MALETLTLAELEQLVRDAIRTRIAGADASPGSDYDLLARAVAVVAQGQQRNALWLADQVLPSTAEAEFLELHAQIRGLRRLQPTASTGRVLLVMDESPASAGNTTQTGGSALAHADGTGYTLDGDATTAKPAWTGKTVGYGSTVARIVVNPDVSTMAAGDVLDVSGVPRAIREVISAVNVVELYVPLPVAPLPGATISARRGVVAAITADDTGAAGNKVAGDSLTVASPAGASPDDIQATAYVQELDGGGDLEADADLRNRVRDYIAHRPGAGSPADYREWSRDSNATGHRIGDAFVYPGIRGLGTVDVVLWGVSGARMVSETARAAIDAYVATVAGFADDVAVEAISYASPTDVTIQVEPRVGYEPDWLHAAYSVAGAPASTTTRIYTATSAVGVIEVGDRVLVPISVAGRSRLAHVRVTAVAATYLDVDTLAAAPAASAAIYSGGPLCDGIIAAVDAVFDALGPGNTTGGTTYQRHPDAEETADHKLRRSMLVDALMGLAGVADVTVTAPGAGGAEPAAKAVLLLGDLTIEHV